MGIFDFLNPPAANVPPPNINTYQASGFGQADAGVLGGIGNLSQFNQFGAGMPQAQGVSQNLFNNPYAGGYQNGSITAAGWGQGAASNAFNQGNNLYGQGGNLFGMGQNIAQTAFDPQNALYGRTLQQVQDQSRAGQAARGIAMTPYGAGLEDQNIRNFNMDWQNQMLQRQIQGGQAMGGLFGQGAGLIGQGAQMQAGAPGQYLTSSAMPYSTFGGIGQGQLGALTSAGQFGQNASQIPQQQIADYQNYLGWGTGQQNGNNQANLGQFNSLLNQASQGFNQQQTMFGDIGKTIGAVAPYALAMFSDIRVKDDVAPVGKLHDGTPVYSYRYKGDPTPRIGLIAQDVEKVRPDAVFDVGGVKAVDYGKATEFSRGIAALSSWR